MRPIEQSGLFSYLAIHIVQAINGLFCMRHFQYVGLSLVQWLSEVLLPISENDKNNFP